MIVYKVTHNSEIVEFAAEQAAIDYASLHNLSAPTSEEKTVVTEVEIPDVTPRQMRQALILSGVSIETIETALDSLPEPTKSLAKTEWEYSLAFQRSRPLVAQVGALLGWTSEQLDDLWLFAATL